MTSPPNHEDEFQPSLIMMAYQFVFFTFYQIMEQVSTDRFIAYKSALFVSALQSWLALDIVQVGEVVLHIHHYEPSYVAFYAIILPPAMVAYFAVYRYGPWQQYMRYFKRWPVRKLIVGRLLVLITVAGLLTLALRL